MYLPRTLAATITRAMRTFPAIVVTGPRQSGKTTLLREQFGRTHALVSLEDADTRALAVADPRTFLRRYPPPVILDEIQYVPELLSYIKSAIDERRTPGQWLLTGSQNFTLMAGVTQSLAGRVAILSLFPLSVAERIGVGRTQATTERWVSSLHATGTPRTRLRPDDLPTILLRGSFPEVAAHPAVDRAIWCRSYIATYLERDVRSITQIGDRTTFERFLKLCATRTGQELNTTELARDAGISVTTARRWLSILETSEHLMVLQPYYRNLGKRLVKRPKLYLTDTGLATYLLGIHDAAALESSPAFGALFETFIVTDIVKRFLHHGAAPTLSYLRTYDGLEVDIIVEDAERIHGIEVKATATITPRHAAALRRIRDDLGDRVASAIILSRTAHRFPILDGIVNVPWHEALAR